MKFKAKGTLAIDPKALEVDWDFDAAPQSEVAMAGDIALMEIRGPMEHHDDWWFESYDSITKRAHQAFASSAKAVLISGDTPGGEVSGLFDTAKELRRLADATGKLLAWYVDGQTCSAGMALAAAADLVIVPEEARIGSVGIIAEIWNQEGAAAQCGYKCVLVTSGKRKADGHPQQPITEDVQAAIQQSVDEEFGIFKAWIAEQRGVAEKAIEGWEAGIFHGAQGLDVGLADVIGTFTDSLTIVASAINKEAPAGAQLGQATMKVPRTHAAGSAAAIVAAMNVGGTPASGSRAEESDDMSGIRAKLGKKAAEDSDEGRKARKALEALDAEEETDEKDKDKEGDEDGDEGTDEGDEDNAAAAEDDTAATAAEGDEEAAAKAEDEEAKKADGDSKKAEDEARNAEAETDAALSRGDTKAAIRGRNKTKAARARAATYRSQARSHRSNAATHRSLALVHTKLKAISTPVAPDKAANPLSKKLAGSNAALAARGNETQPGKGKKPPTPAASVAGRKPLNEIDPEIRRMAGLSTAEDQGPLITQTDTGIQLGARMLDPKVAKQFVDAFDAAKAGA